MLLIVSLVVPTLASATPADSVNGSPFKLPFNIIVNVKCIVRTDWVDVSNHGITSQGYWTSPVQFGISTTIATDSSNSIYYSWYHLKEDSIEFRACEGWQCITSWIVLDTSIHRIKSMMLYGTYHDSSWRMWFHNLKYDEHQIYLLDSNSQLLLDSLTFYSDFVNNNAHGITTYSTTLNSIDTIEFGGLFETTIISYPAASVQFQSDPRDDISSTLFFQRSNHERTIEYFTPLGRKVANIEIPPGETSVTLPHLPRGLYFIRLGETVIKAYVAE